MAEQDGPCAKCGCRTIYVIDEALIPNYEYSNAVVPLTLTAHYGPTGEKGVFGVAKSVRVPVRIRARVCGECAYTELFATDLDVLERFAKEGVGGVRKLEV